MDPANGSWHPSLDGSRGPRWCTADAGSSSWVLTVWFHRRHRLRWTSAVAGLAGPPVLLGLLLAVAPAILSRAGLLST